MEYCAGGSCADLVSRAHADVNVAESWNRRALYS